jgi:hypothetical protein
MFVKNVTNTFPPKRIYYRQWKKREMLILFGWFGLMLWWMVDHILRGDDIFPVIVPLPIILLYLAVLYMGLVYERVVVSSSGIELRDTLYTIRVGWSEIEALKEVEKGSLRLDVLTLKVPRMEQKSRMRWAFYWNFQAHLQSDGEFIPVEKIIPLGLMFPKWRDSELGRDFQQYIPELFAAPQDSVVN